ncbi:LysR family transcriptional regulator [Nannocystis radixulma]|uniref:LysR family transcriptional regulator n=1 Tax=Nannocystis radixulma TaxID=2995305 RepID=A0ABT5B011_9BACT|nr:LysR family transcriptional regulator [Nannocystis radixulma]MDC0667030.1 LysR family transcriptional regulator [Nannocystis radixulma]
MLSSLDDLRYLEAFERLGSAAAAGRDLGVAPSTVYRRIAALEQAVGFVCLERSRGITAAGRELAALARTTSVTLAGIARRARDRREEVRGTITVTTIDGFGPLLVAPIAALAAAFPLLRVDVHISDAGLSLRKGQAEIGLGLLSDPPQTLVGRKLFPVQFGVYGTRALAAEPEHARWLVLGTPLHNSWLGQWEREHVPQDRVAFATPSRRLLVDLAVASVGLNLMPARLAAEHPELVEVKQFRATTAPLTRPAWILTHPDLRKDARVSVVMKMLARHLAQADG